MAVTSNMILLTVVREATLTVSYQELFNPEKMSNIRTSGTNVSFEYPASNGQIRQLEVGPITISALQGVVNTNSPQGKTVVVGIIDFALGHSVAGTYTLKDANGNDILIPTNSRVTTGYMETVTTFTGATATLAIGYPVDGTTTAVLPTTTATTLTAGTKTALTPVGTAATATAKTTGARALTLTIATATVTAGKAYVYIEIVTTGL